ncbi:F-box only protein 50 isoform X1 [Panthera uncia]|uniref:F-box only protein 50 isoform X1 n=1 Tax=Panthera uncia TaxID=29064 RepID=UPI0020FFC660|nr:F-box only protein 50 isoform X1 [Panthera uncia]
MDTDQPESPREPPSPPPPPSPPSPPSPAPPESPGSPRPEQPSEAYARQLLLEEWGPPGGSLELPPRLTWKLLFLRRPLYRNLLRSPNPEGAGPAGHPAPKPRLFRRARHPRSPPSLLLCPSRLLCILPRLSRHCAPLRLLAPLFVPPCTALCLCLYHLPLLCPLVSLCLTPYLYLSLPPSACISVSFSTCLSFSLGPSICHTRTPSSFHPPSSPHRRFSPPPDILRALARL